MLIVAGVSLAKGFMVVMIIIVRVVMIMLVAHLGWVRVGGCVERVSTWEAPRAESRLSKAAPSSLAIHVIIIRDHTCHHQSDQQGHMATCSCLGLEERWDPLGAGNLDPGTRTLNVTCTIDCDQKSGHSTTGILIITIY